VKERFAAYRFLLGPALTLLVLIVIEASNRWLFTIPNPGVIYFTAVVFAAFHGGMVPGLLSAGITLVYAALFFSKPGAPFTFTPDNFARMLVLLVSTPAVAVMVGFLQRRAVHTTALLRERDRAEAATRVKSAFVASMSHELRTPLNAILGFSEMLERGYWGTVNAKQKEYLADIRHSAAHQLALVNDLLDLERIEAGMTELVEERVLLREELDKSLKLIEERARAANLTLTIDAPDEIAIQADRRRIRQIMINLLSNAVKFTPAGGRVTIEASASPQAGLSLAVVNSGVRLSDTDIKRILKPFQQLDTGIAYPYEGTGLGLPISKGLAELHGGSLEIVNRRPEGTAVIVRFPANRVLGRAPDTPGTPPSAAARDHEAASSHIRDSVAMSVSARLSSRAAIAVMRSAAAVPVASMTSTGARTRPAWLSLGSGVDSIGSVTSRCPPRMPSTVIALPIMCSTARRSASPGASRIRLIAAPVPWPCSKAIGPTRRMGSTMRARFFFDQAVWCANASR
jgi:signal transduction histidine kinase